MSDFDPQQQNMVVSEQLKEKKQKKKGNKLTRNSSHPICVVITLILSCWPLVFAIIQMIPGINIPVVAAYIVFPIGIGISFYHNKNFAGRYLGKLRWHMYSVDGKGYYYFESLEKDNQTKCDSFTFWFCLWFIVIYNAVTTIAYIFTVTSNLWSIPLSILGFVCGLVNLIAYIRCSRDFRIKTKKMAKNIGQRLVESQTNSLQPQQTA